MKARNKISRSKDSTNDAFQYALRLLNIRERTEKELLERLEKKGFNKQSIESTLNRLKELNLLNDRRAAEALLNYGITVKGLGSKGLRRFCTERGVDESILNELIDEQTDEKRAEELVRKRLPSMEHISYEKKYQRLFGYLYRRGYSVDVIKKVLKRNLNLEV